MSEVNGYKEGLTQAIEFLTRARDSEKVKVQMIGIIKAVQAIHMACIAKMGDDVLKKLNELEDEPEDGPLDELLRKMKKGSQRM